MNQFKSYIFSFDPEFMKMQSWIKELTKDKAKKTKILDVGCWYGRHLRWLVRDGYDALGVDLNERVVADNVRDGFPCVSPGKLKEHAGQFDLIIMSHIIEHFSPSELFSFLDGYLEYLRPGGHLLIATPLKTNYFYDDFDHVKPYHPNSIPMVFRGVANDGGIPYNSKARLELEKLWYRKAYFQLRHLAGRQLRCASTPWIKLMDYAFATVFRVSGGNLGRTIGWVGLYRKN